MAVDQLSLYNDSLRILGERELSSLTENRPPRYRLDGIYNFDAVDYCLELVKPRFATVVDKITTASTDTEHGFSYVYTLPADHIALDSLYSDSKLDEPIERYIVQGQTLATDHNPIYLRYVQQVTPSNDWTPTFARLVSAYMAQQVAARFRPELVKVTNEAFAAAFKASMESDAIEEKSPRARPTTATLTNDWLHIYNDALFILEQEQLISVNDGSDRRAKLDAALSQSLVENRLEDTSWRWALTSNKIQYNPSLDPEWGYQYVFDKPADIQRLDGVFSDEYMQAPLKYYREEGSMWFADLTEIYVSYVSTDMVSTPSAWPAYFKKLIAADMAYAAGGVIGVDRAIMDKAKGIVEDRKTKAFTEDAIQSPPRMLSSGSWVRSRTTDHNSRRRP